MYTCADCTVIGCLKGDLSEIPKNCPMREEDIKNEAIKEYKKPEIRRFHSMSSKVEKTGYCEWSRVREVVEFCRAMGYKKIGLAFCVGLQREAKTFSGIMRKAGFDVVSVCCKNGSIPKEDVGIEKEYKLNPDKFEACCNPIGQAKYLNSQNTEFNVVIGLCVGHDSLFFKYVDAMTTVLIAKDRAMGHNPVAALYTANGYSKKKLGI